MTSPWKQNDLTAIFFISFFPSSYFYFSYPKLFFCSFITVAKTRKEFFFSFSLDVCLKFYFISLFLAWFLQTNEFSFKRFLINYFTKKRKQKVLKQFSIKKKKKTVSCKEKKNSFSLQINNFPFAIPGLSFFFFCIFSSFFFFSIFIFIFFFFSLFKVF